MVQLPREINLLMESLNLEYRTMSSRQPDKRKFTKVQFLRKDFLTGKLVVVYTYKCDEGVMDTQDAIITGIREIQKKGLKDDSLTPEGSNIELQQTVSTLNDELKASRDEMTRMRTQIDSLKDTPSAIPAAIPAAIPPPVAPERAWEATEALAPEPTPPPPAPAAVDPTTLIPLPDMKKIWAIKNEEIVALLTERGLASPPAGRQWRKNAVEALTSYEKLYTPTIEDTPEAALETATVRQVL